MQTGAPLGESVSGVLSKTREPQTRIGMQVQFPLPEAPCRSPVVGASRERVEPFSSPAPERGVGQGQA